MLTSLTIQNFVLIDNLTLTFDKGFCVFTGETGAGKSILLDALSLVLGARSETRFVQKGATQTVVSAVFSLPKKHKAFQLLDDQGLMHEDELILRRLLTKEGKTKAFICDQPVSITLLKSVGETLVEIHGQFASYSLMNPATHLFTLDTYGKLDKQKDMVKSAWENYISAKREADTFEQQLNSKQAEEELLRADLEALDKLNPQSDEEEKLTKRRAELMNAERILENIQNASNLLDDEECGTLRLLEKLESQLSNADKITEGNFENELKALSDAQNILADLSSNLEHTLNDCTDTSELPQIDDRLFALRDMARKYRISIAELPTFREEVRQKLFTAENGSQKLAELKEKTERLYQIYGQNAEVLSTLRLQAAQNLDSAVMKELPDLKLDKAIFKTQLTKLSWDMGDSTGINQAVFTAAINKGSDLTPIHKCASGGELARFMLALKVNLAENDDITLIFDEIDSGVSGATATAVGERLACLAHEHQTLVITHSPQVAACAKHQYLVKKTETETKSSTSVTLLNHKERLEEIARLLSGTTITDKARAVAKELLESTK